MSTYPLSAAWFMYGKKTSACWAREWRFESFEVDTCSLDAASPSIPAALRWYCIEADAKTYAKTFVMVLENNVIELAVVANSAGTVANS